MVLGPLAGLSPVGLILGGIAVYTAVSLVLSYLRRRRYPQDIKTISAGTNFFAPLTQTRVWVQQGYDVYNKQGKAYLLPGPLGNEPQVVMPRSQMAWMLDQPDDMLSTSAAHYATLHGDYSFVDPIIVKDPYHEHVIHRSLARQLSALDPELQDEVQASADDIFGFDDKGWATITIWDALLRFIPRVTNRMLVGPVVCRNQEYLDNMVGITDDIVRNLLILTIIPSALRRLVGPLASLPAKYHFHKSSRHVLPLIKQRLSDMERKAQGDPAYADWVPPNDYISWHIATALAEGRADEYHPVRVAQRLVPVNFAAIHTTALAALNVFLDILSSDAEYSTIAAISDEVRRVYADEGGHWTKAGLGRLYRLDSAIRESMRVNAFSQLLVSKMVVAREGVTNPETGWHFEHGTMLVCPLWGAQHDPDVFGEKADAYDPFRYSRPREEFEAKDAGEKSAEERLKLQRTGMVTTSDSHFPFGHGRHACPGRFFVAHELKMLFAHVLLNYELAPLKERPANQWIASNIIPPTKATMQLKRRTGTF
ncbi:cytochrome P450 [Thozetella sp. PMI_491]|nr:cytochrome P450 [Thozetella sp. PMI_491]